MVPMTRRRFLKSSAMAAGVTILPSGLLHGQSANEKLNIACIGVGGRGAAHVIASLSQNLVALCDIDDNHLNGALTAINAECESGSIPRPDATSSPTARCSTRWAGRSTPWSSPRRTITTRRQRAGD